jgi:hypothetical protein
VTDERRRYRLEVETLLEQIRSQVGEFQRLKVAGARGPALTDLKDELAGVRSQLASLVR